MSLTNDMVSCGIQSHRAQAINGSVATGLTAVGSSLATALPLTASTNVIGTAAASTGVTLPVATIGDSVTIRNGGANAVLVYPATATGVVNALAAGAGFSMAAGKNATFTMVDADTWIAVLSA